MKRGLKYTISLAGLVAILIFCVSATTGITNPASAVVGHQLNDSISMLLLGIGLVGLRSFVKNQMANR